MRKIIVFMAGVAVLGAPVYVFGTGFGSLVSSFKSPGSWPGGVSCWQGELYITTYNKVVFRTTTTGSIITYHPTSIYGLSGITVGTVAGRTYYWVGAAIQGYVYRFVDNSSTVDGSFPVPGGIWRGLTFVDSSHMYYANQEESRLYLLHPMTGSIFSSYKLNFKSNDLAYDKSGYLWIASGSDRAIYKCTLTGSPLASFKTPFREPHWPQGCGFDGEYVWVGDGDPVRGWDIVAQFDVRSEPAVNPASLGRIKALYR